MKKSVMKKNSLFSFFLVLVLFAAVLGQSTPVDANPGNAPSLVVESIQVSGNTKTGRDVILSLLDFRAGDRIDQEQLDRNVRHLEETNFFKDVDVYTQPGSDRGKIQVFVEVRERSWPFFQFRSGFSELDGWYISPLAVRFDNIFGHGNYMGAEVLIGDRVSGLDISFLRSNFMNSDLNVRFLLFTRNREFVHYVDDQKNLQNVSSSGISIRLNGNRGIMKYLWFDFVRESFQADNFMWPAGNKNDHLTLPGVLQPFSGKKEVGRFIVSLYADTRDQRFYPMHGWWGSISLNQASAQLGAFADYKRAIVDVRRYQLLGQGVVFAMRLKAGWIDDSAPFYEKFYLGGPNSLRGYADRSLNPLGYASRLVLGSAEIRFPITHRNFPRQFLTGVLFYDAGQAWNAAQEFDSGDIHTSLGYGFRFKLPIVGLVRLDFAYPVPTYDFRVHLSLGHTF